MANGTGLKLRRWLITVITTLAACLGSICIAPTAAGWNLFDDPVTPVAAQVGSLFNLIMIITGGILFVVWTVLSVAIWRYRHQPGRIPRLVHGNIVLEIVWTVVPAILLLIIAVPSYRTLMAMETIPPPDLTVEVIGHQWYWEYRYPDSGLILTNQPLRVPAHRNIKLLLTSADVIHNWYVPDFAFKISTIPGRINQTWFRTERAGSFVGQCAELCGTLHSRMQIAVEAMPPEAFAGWQRQMVAQSQGQAAGGAGKALYETNCAACHQLNGEGLAGAIPPLAGAEIPSGPPDAHISLVLKGKMGPLTVKSQTYNGVMPPFVQLSDEELAAIITYERTTWGNRGSTVTPAQVRALRGR